MSAKTRKKQAANRWYDRMLNELARPAAERDPQSANSQYFVRTIERAGSAELRQKVRDGEIGLSAGAKAARALIKDGASTELGGGLT